MNDFLQRFELLKTRPSKDRFLIEINARIDVYAYLCDQLKKDLWKWNKETNELCIIRDMALKNIREEEKNEIQNQK